MGEWVFLQTLQRYVDPVSIAFAMTTCWLIKNWFFRDTGADKGELRPGTFWARVFPTLPVLLATAFVLASGYKNSPTDFLVSKGIVSGTMAGFFHRTWKVSVRGE